MGSLFGIFGRLIVSMHAQPQTSDLHDDALLRGGVRFSEAARLELLHQWNVLRDKGAIVRRGRTNNPSLVRRRKGASCGGDGACVVNSKVDAAR